MAEEVDDMIKEYFEEKGYVYGVEFEHFSIICKTPFLFFRKMMELIELPLIKIKYLGKFLIYPGTIKSIHKAVTAQFERGEITAEEYQAKTINLKLHEDDEENNDDPEEGEADD